MLGEPWCAIWASVKLRDGNAQPTIWSARAKDFALQGYSYKLSDIIYGRYHIKAGDCRVKARRGGNHVDFIENWDGEKGLLIGGNVSDAVTQRRVELRQMMFDGTNAITDITGYYKADTILTGIASYYHPSLHGNRTASGEIYDETQLTAAHRSLPFGTRVKVTYMKKSIIVRINDRGPYIEGRVIDLSKAAADSLNLKLGKVEIEVLKWKQE